jgi:hypothetical protein
LLNYGNKQQPVSLMIMSEIAVTGTSPPASTPTPPQTPPQTPPADHQGFSFHDFLSAINPLQYLPVVGTIYRAITGDIIPEALQRIGSFVVSGLLGGPIGLAINAATTLVEKVTDIDPEKILMAQIRSTPTAAAPRDGPAASTTTPAQPDPAPMEQVAITPQQLAAYGVRSSPSGNLKLGDLQGADVLNTIQLVRLGRTAAAAYAANQPPALVAAASPGG